ncbi:MAG: hypothetical protein CL733_00395 [Chloroflexi bacterium]|nr:hypothetical protein [Chloroflexota bacterium]
MQKIKKIFFYILGMFFVGLGIAGYILPGLPGTVFLILAAACFVRSSDKMYRWVTEHKLFGAPVKNFLETGGIPYKIKIIAVASIIIFSSISLLAPYSLLFFKIPVGALAISGIMYILTRPTT